MTQAPVSSTPARRDGPPHDRGGRLLVVVGGLPGSGKTTLLRRIQRPGLSGLDSEQVADRLPGAVPYRVLRPLVHVLHRYRVLRAVAAADPVVVLADPWTSPRWRAAVLRAATRAGRGLRFVLIDASAADAVQGQVARGRGIPPHRMRRHEQRFAELLREAGEEVVVVDRAAARLLTVDDVLGNA